MAPILPPFFFFEEESFIDYRKAVAIIHVTLIEQKLYEIVSSSSYPFPTKWSRYNMFLPYCVKNLQILFTTGRLSNVNSPWE
jgi:hypothetical protein